MFGAHSFRGGIELPLTMHSRTPGSTLTLPEPCIAIVPLVQHSGSPARPAVNVGDRVERGQIIAEPIGPFSITLHAPVAGTVVAIEPRPHPDGPDITAIVIENDGTGREQAPLEPIAWEQAEPSVLHDRLLSAGVVDTRINGRPLSACLPDLSAVRRGMLIVDATEYEPMAVSNHALICESAQELVEAALVCARACAAQRVRIAVTGGLRPGLRILKKALAARKNPSLRLARIVPRYPQNTLAQLVEAMTGREIPRGGSPADVGCAVVRASAAVAAAAAVLRGQPSTSVRLSVAGVGIEGVRSVVASLGTPLRGLLDAVQCDTARVRKVVCGGVMNGAAQASLDAPVTKTMNSVTTHDRTFAPVSDCECIRCGMCYRVCPMRLVPAMFALFVRGGGYDDARRWGVEECTECGVCSAVCPARVNLVHYVKLGKKHLSERVAEIGTQQEAEQ